MTNEAIAVFALNSSREFGERVCSHLGCSLSAHEEREFEDGEHKARPLASVREKDVFVIQSLYGDAQLSVNDKLCRLLFFVGALNDASARRVTAVIPYLCYARKDRKSKPRDPVTTRYIAALFETVGTHSAVTMDVHNLAAYQNAWRIPTDHLEAKVLFANYMLPLLGHRDVVVVSPDVGGVKRANDFRQTLSRALGSEIPSAFVEKYRSDDVLSGGTVVGDVSGRLVIIIDDLISSGTTLVRAAEACRERGAATVYAAASHGVFSPKAGEILSNSALEKIIVTNTVPPFRLEQHSAQRKLTVLDAAPLFAEAIKRAHSGESISELSEI